MLTRWLAAVCLGAFPALGMAQTAVEPVGPALGASGFMPRVVEPSPARPRDTAHGIGMPSGLGLGAGDGAADGSSIVNGAVWQFTPSFAIGPGVGVSRRGAETFGAFPVILVDWRITDAVNLGTATTPRGGAGIEAQYRAGGALTFGVGAAYEGFSFGPAGRRRADGSEEPGGEVPVFATATFTPNPFVSLSVTGGVSFGGAAGASNADDEVDEGRVGAAPFVGLNGSLRF